MRMLNKQTIFRTFQRKNIEFFDPLEFAKIFNIKNKNTLYKKLQSLEKAQIIKRLNKGLYQFSLAHPNDFTLANYLYQPSYISLETALSFYGIITGFPYKITSVTPKKSRTIIANDKEFAYSQIKLELFWGYEKQDNFLIAEKEKALLDYLYFYSKGLKEIDFKEMDLDQINKRKLLSFAKKADKAKLLRLMKKIL